MASATENQPSNTSYLSPLGFRFVLNRTPKTNYFVQNAVLPSVSLTNFDIPNPLISRPMPGTKLTYEPLSLTFMVDEDMVNYLELYDWLTGLGTPTSTNQRKELQDRSLSFKKDFSSIFSDGTLFVLTSHHNANVKVVFKELFPIALSDLSFDSTLTDVEYLRATVTYQYLNYTIEKK
jgi:hypothetical protein